MVLAIMGARNVHLVESDQRKVAFLREAARCVGAAVQIHPTRIEKLVPFIADVVTARALAPLDTLLSWTAPYRGPETVSLFLKGQTVAGELTAAHKQWTMKMDRHQSLTDPTGTILALREVHRVRDEPARDAARGPPRERK